MDLGLLPDPLPLQFGFTCSDVADAAIVANAQYQDAKVGFKDLFFAAISRFASYVKNDLRHGVPPANPFQIARSEAALVLKEVEGPSTVAVIALNGVAQQFYSHYVARTQMGIIAAVWNDMNCGSGHVTAGVEIIAGNPVSFHGTMYLVCVEEWIDLVIGGNGADEPRPAYGVLRNHPIAGLLRPVHSGRWATRDRAESPIRAAGVSARESGRAPALATSEWSDHRGCSA